MITQMINQKNFIKVGNINTRDFTYIDDTINGYQANKFKKIDADQINIASGFEIEIKSYKSNK